MGLVSLGYRFLFVGFLCLVFPSKTHADTHSSESCKDLLEILFQESDDSTVDSIFRRFDVGEPGNGPQQFADETRALFVKLQNEFKAEGVPTYFVETPEEFFRVWQEIFPTDSAFLKDSAVLASLTKNIRTSLPFVIFDPHYSGGFVPENLYSAKEFFGDTPFREVPLFVWSPRFNHLADAGFESHPALRFFNFVFLSNDAVDRYEGTEFELHELSHFSLFKAENSGHVSPFSMAYEAKRLESLVDNHEYELAGHFHHIRAKFGLPDILEPHLGEELFAYLGYQSFDEILMYALDFLNILEKHLRDPVDSERALEAVQLLSKSFFLAQRAQSELRPYVEILSGVEVATMRQSVFKDSSLFHQEEFLVGSQGKTLFTLKNETLKSRPQASGNPGRLFSSKLERQGFEGEALSTLIFLPIGMDVDLRFLNPEVFVREWQRQVALAQSGIEEILTLFKQTNFTELGRAFDGEKIANLEAKDFLVFYKEKLIEVFTKVWRSGTPKK